MIGTTGGDNSIIMPHLESSQQQRLLTALAEELKLPLVRIARTLELGQPSQDDIASLQLVANMALQTVDAYILSLSSPGQYQMNLEPVGISSVMYDVAHELSKFESLFGNKVQLHSPKNYGPVVAEQTALKTALVLMGYTAMAGAGDDTSAVTLGIHKSNQGAIVAGAYTNNSSVTSELLRRARALTGSSRQVLPTEFHGNGAGLFVAEGLLASFGSQLKVARHARMQGLATALFPSQQLQLV